MDAIAIFGLLEKGLTLIPTLLNAGMSITSLVQNMTKVAADAKEGKQVSPTDIAALEADLDAGLAAFNARLPPE